ncbi:MAG TPA: carbamoyltransferase C-terminal domain-containing protein [Candidatus Margulisiibacteriota bacterium]|nr:carbamoyltransferase C-terminal domain-containing protein [Candidatus Margulisiibacteriota bacterium]
MSVVLGLNAYHAGASAAIIVDGEIRFAIAEERLNRRKYYGGFPILAMRRCLEAAGITPAEIDFVAVGRDSGANLGKKLAYVATHPLLLGNLLTIRRSRSRLGDLRSEIASALGARVDDLRFRQVNIEHHLAHTASAFFLSGYDEAAGITIDGSGDFVTCMMSACKGDEIRPLHRIYVPESLGSLYTMICQFIGYRKYGDEGKVMGLAPLGRDTFRAAFQEMIRFEEGQIRLSPLYFLPFGSDQGMSISESGETILRRQYSEKMVEMFGAAREPYGDITERDQDLAFGLQQRFEEIYFALLNHLHGLVPLPHVVMAGGCALNSVANGKLFDHTPFRNTWIQPAAGDEGLALGAALYVVHSVLKERVNRPLANAYLGGEYGDEEIKAVLDESGIRYQRLNRDDLLERTAHEIADGKVVGWFQGRSEWGPRALCNRSILCHPGYPGMKDILNARIKRREAFRPFAPVVKAERQSEIFERADPSPFMLHVYEIRPEWRARLSAVNHVDNTGRLQTLAREDNPLAYDLVSAFECRTGIPVILNTSFNENEPVVEQPREAVDCYLRTKMDVLTIGSFLCTK